jgi:hypothetical protein
LRAERSEPLAIEILDSSGALLRRASTTDAPLFTPEELAARIDSRVLDPDRAAARRERRHAPLGLGFALSAPRAAQRGFPISAVPADTPQEPLGPLAAPGTYRVRLQIGKQQWEQSLTVVGDPRVESLGGGTRRAIRAVEAPSRRARCEHRRAARGALAACAIEGIKRRARRARRSAARTTISIWLRSSRLPMRIKCRQSSRSAVSNDSTAISRLLYGELSRADAAPTRAQRAEAERAIKDWQALEPQWALVRVRLNSSN